MRRRALALLFFFSSAACGLAFSPGDYREPSEVAPATSNDGSASVNEGGVLPNEGGNVDAGPTRTKIALFAGRRDGLPGETGSQVTIAETMLTSIGSDGTLGPIAFDAPPAPAGLWTHAVLAGGEIHLYSAGTLVHAPFTDHVSGSWTSAAVPSPPDTGVKGWVLDAHGLLSGRASAGSNTQTWGAAFADGGIASWLNLGAKTTVVRGNSRLFRAGDHVYIAGGETPGSERENGEPVTGHPEIEVARLGANGEPGDFHATASLPALPSLDGGAYATFEPVAATSPDHVYLLGGLTTSNASSLADVVVAAKIKDATTGDLDPWVVLPKLPAPMSGFAAVVTPAWLVVFGGQVTGGKTTAAIVRLAIHADGTFGTTWETAGELPGGRSAIVGVTY